ncbi:MAG: glucose-6-phosphate isomerase [Cellvibrionaceae bacterium]
MHDPIQAADTRALDHAWESLAEVAQSQLQPNHCGGLKLDIQAEFASDCERVVRYSREAVGLRLDFSRHAVNPVLWQSLLDLAKAAQVPKAVEAMFRGEKINHTEQRQVLHTALRGGLETSSSGSLGPQYQQVQRVGEELAALIERVHSGQRCGYAGDGFTDVVNIGIGGSDLGPAMVTDALTPYHNALNVHFVSNVDPSHLVNTLKDLNPETTLFVIASKTFTTLETLANAKSARAWLREKAGDEAKLSSHFVAVTSNVSKAEEFGIDGDSVYPMWDWVGGRYSLWSAIGLPIALAVGWRNFQALCQGAQSMDRHFATAPLEQNLPVILSLLEILSVNILGAQSHAVLPYDQNLSQFPAFLQQLTMESNGKRVDRSGKLLSRPSCPVVWGAAGTNGQHSFHQLLHQGTSAIATDFLVPLQSHNPLDDQHTHLVTNCMAQARALLFGKTEADAYKELIESGYDEQRAKALAPHKVLPGNRPSLTLSFDETTPETLGALIALYEHKVFVSSVIWQINAFDQWGVELGKQIGQSIYQEIQARRCDAESVSEFDPSTEALLQQFIQLDTQNTSEEIAELSS